MGPSEEVAVPNNHKIALCSLFTLLFLFTVGCREEARGESEDTEQTIEFLIAAVGQSHLIFIRNGEDHTSVEAAGHIRDKYDYFRSRIKTPEDFISLCASKSLLSGKCYLVSTAQGKIPVEKWLGQKLSEHRKSP